MADPVIVGDVKARAVRGRGKRGPHDGRLYWRAELHRKTVWTGWATREEAAVALAQLVASGVERGRPKVADIRTMYDLLDYWVGSVVDGRADTAERTKLAARGAGKRAKKDIGDVRLDRVTRQTLEDWVALRLRRGDASYTIRYDLTVVRRAWRWGRELGATPDVDLPTPSLNAKPKRTKRTPTPEEVREVIAWLQENAPRWCVPLIYLAAATGARIGELTGLQWSDIDLEASTIRVVGKTGERTIPVRRDVLTLLGGLPRTDGPVWGVSKETSRAVIKFVHRANDKAGRPRWTTHGLRRLAVDQLARSGVDVGTAAALLGHSPAVMLNAYRQVSLDDMRRGIAAAGLGVSTGDGTIIDLAAHRSAHKSVGE